MSFAKLNEELVEVSVERGNSKIYLKGYLAHKGRDLWCVENNNGSITFAEYQVVDFVRVGGWLWQLVINLDAEPPKKKVPGGILLLQKTYPGNVRAWVKCRCGFVATYQYQPYSLSSPIMTLPCGHSFYDDTTGISEEEALNDLYTRYDTIIDPDKGES